VTADDYGFAINHNGLTPAKFLYGSRDLIDGRSRNLPGVPGKGDYFVDWPRRDAQLIHQTLSTKVV
jgi:hypothetical protein